MPFVIYLFTLSAFALGLAEFIPIGLTAVMAHGLQVSVEQAGGAVTWYALGASFAAPVLTALTAAWPRKRTMLMTVLVFASGSLAAALAHDLPTLLAARFVAGMGHGLFLAVASSVAAQLAGPQRAGTAVAIVFGGFTVAMAAGVPLGTYLGAALSWRLVLTGIAAFGLLGFAGLAMGMKEPAGRAGQAASVASALKALLHPALLSAALVTVLAYGGSFAVYTYIAPLLVQVSGVQAATVGLFMLAYGVFAALGNAAGGRLTDRLGVDRASLIVVVGIALSVAGMSVLASLAWAMAVLSALLGFFTFAAVPALQARLMGVARDRAPHAQSVAAGLNIAGFNSGIALGSWAGGLTLNQLGVGALGVTGAVIAALALGLLLLLMARARPASLPAA